MPAKHQPDLIYLRYVPLWKVHSFTLVQLTCLVLLWVIKASAAAVVFPMMVMTSNPKDCHTFSLFAFTLYAKDKYSASPFQVNCHNTEECISAIIWLKEIPDITVLHNYVHLHMMKILCVLFAISSIFGH